MFLFSFFVILQTQALALTRPKSPKLERSRSPPSLFKQCDSLRSPINDIHQQLSSPKTPVAVKTHTPLSDTSSSNLNSSNLNSISKITTSQLSLSENMSSSNNNENMNNGLNINNNHLQPVASMNGPDKLLPSPSNDRKDFDFSKVNGELHFILFFLPILYSKIFKKKLIGLKLSINSNKC